MRMFLKSATMALVLTGAVLGVAGTANAATVRIGIPGISLGYRDGYMDDHRRYHRWHNRRDYRDYRMQHADTYSDWNHNRRHH